jgi:hypothetical protein
MVRQHRLRSEVKLRSVNQDHVTLLMAARRGPGIGRQAIGMPCTLSLSALYKCLQYLVNTHIPTAGCQAPLHTIGPLPDHAWPALIVNGHRGEKTILGDPAIPDDHWNSPIAQ